MKSTKHTITHKTHKSIQKRIETHLNTQKPTKKTTQKPTPKNTKTQNPQKHTKPTKIHKITHTKSWRNHGIAMA